METIGEQIDHEFAYLRATVDALAKRVAALETPKPPPAADDVPWSGEKFAEIDSKKINPDWDAANGSRIPGWDAKIILPFYHMPPHERLDGGIHWNHVPTASNNHSQLRIAVYGQRGKYMAAVIPWYMQPDRTYGFAFDFTYSDWPQGPKSWINMFQLHGWLDERTQKDVVALFYKSGGLVCHCYDHDASGRGNYPIPLAAGQTHRIALQVRSGLTRSSHVTCWLQRLDKSWWKIFSFKDSLSLGAGQLMQEPDALFDVRFGPYSNSTIERVVYDRIQYWLVDE